MKKDYSQICFTRGVVAACLAAAVMILIFVFSSQEADESAALSSGILQMILDGKVPVLSWIAIQTHFFDIIPIRKAAHFLVYLLLGVLTAASAGNFRQAGVLGTGNGIEGMAARTLLPWGICILYAASDEFHQTFVNGRSGELRDIVIDSSGAILGVLASAFLVYLMYRIHITKQKSL